MRTGRQIRETPLARLRSGFQGETAITRDDQKAALSKRCDCASGSILADADLIGLADRIRDVAVVGAIVPHSDVNQDRLGVRGERLPRLRSQHPVFKSNEPLALLPRPL